MVKELDQHKGHDDVGRHEFDADVPSFSDAFAENFRDHLLARLRRLSGLSLNVCCHDVFSGNFYTFLKMVIVKPRMMKQLTNRKASRTRNAVPMVRGMCEPSAAASVKSTAPELKKLVMQPGETMW